ncbi:MAG: NlpC/P60 family protein [Lachnospiraceae bacterium]
MKRLSKTLVAVLAVGSLVVTPVLAAPSGADTTQSKKKAMQSEVSSLQNELTSVMTKINELEASMITKGQEIEKANAELAAAQEKEKKQYEAMKLRIQYMYEEGDASSAALEDILESGSTAKLINQVEYFQNVHKYDRKQLQAYEETKKQIESLKASLELDMQNMAQMENDFTSQQTSLGATITEKQAEVSDLDAQLQAAAEVASARAQKAEAEADQRAAAQNPVTEERNNVASAGNTQQPSQGNGEVKVPEVAAPQPGTPEADAPQSDAPEVVTPQPGTPEADAPEIDVPEVVTPQPGAPEADVPQPDVPEVVEPDAPSNSSVADIVVSTAWSYIGVPYVYGGNGYNGIDCSGLTKACYAAAGISIPRTSGSQAAVGQNVGGLANALPGDIVCYSGHVAIYLGGNRVIHAPQPGDVVKEASVYMGSGQPILKVVRF